jgi:glycosyltransferase involved in cell wall biosynthesis
VIGSSVNPVPTAVPWSGIELMVTCLVKGLVELGHDVALVSVEGSLWRGWDAIDLIEVKVAGPDIERSFFEGYRDKIKDFDCVIDNSNGKMARLANPRTINVSHWLQDPAAMGFRNVVCISEAHKRWTLEQYRLRSVQGSVMVVYNGIDPSMYPFREEKGDEFLFLSVMGEYKGADTVLELAKRHPEHRFGFAGRATSFSEVIKKEAETRRNISYYGEVPHDKKKELMGRARALLQLPKGYDPSAKFPFMDIFPMTVIEANLCGTPVVGLARDGVPEMIRQNVNGILCDNIECVERAIEGLSDGTICIPPKSCRAYAEERFSHIRMASDYAKLCSKVISGKSW